MPGYNTDKFTTAFEPGDNRFGIRVKEIIFPEDFILKGGDRSSHIKLKCTLFQTLKTDDDTVFFDTLRRSIVNKKMFCDIWTPEISDVYKRGKYLFFEVMCYLPRSSEDKIIHLDRVIQASPGIQGVELAQGKFVQEFFSIVKSGMEIDDALARVSYLMEHPEELKPEVPVEKEVKKEKAPVGGKAVEKPKGKEKEAENEKEKEKPAEKEPDKKKVKKKKKSKKEMKSEALLGAVLTELEKREEEEEAASNAIFCPKCEEEIEPDWMNCPSCGVRLREHPATPSPEAAAVPTVDPVARARMDKALELANDEIDAEAKAGVSLDGAKLHMTEARVLFEKGDFDGSEACIRLAMAALDEARQAVEARAKPPEERPSPVLVPEQAPAPAPTPEPAETRPEPSKEPMTELPAQTPVSASQTQYSLSLPPLPDLSVSEQASPSQMLSFQSGTKEPAKSFSLPKLPRFSWEREESPARSPPETSATDGCAPDTGLRLEVKEDGPRVPEPEPKAPEPAPPPVVEEVKVTQEPPKIQEDAERVEEKAPDMDMREGKGTGKEEKKEKKKKKKEKEEKEEEEKKEKAVEEKEKKGEEREEEKKEDGEAKADNGNDKKKEETGGLSDLLARLKDFK